SARPERSSARVSTRSTVTCDKRIYLFLIPAARSRRPCAVAVVAPGMALAWKCVWPSTCRTIPGWPFFFASRAILSAADYVRECKSNSRKAWDLDYYQTVYAKEPGSAEMPSAGRAFTWKLLLDLKRRGIESAYIILHTGLSSYMDDELDRAYPASEEEYFVSQITAEKINSAR